MQQLEFTIYGRVQGIRFRKLVENFVKFNNLNGFVQNNDDGTVGGTLQGEKENLDDFVSWVESNPGFSKVTKLVKNFSEVEQEGEEIKEFEIKKEKGFLKDKLSAVGNLFKSVSLGEELNVPNHVAIIPDGNRRWAEERGMEGYRGHEHAGRVESITALAEEVRKFGVKYVTFWGFSTENWKREKEENDKLLGVLLKGIEGFLEYAHENKVRFSHFGRRDRFSKEIVEALNRLESETKDYGDFNVALALDYGGRDEILRAVNKLLVLKAKKVSEEQFSKVLDTHDFPEPDLIVRTSGEKRLSGFLPWQGVYAELIFVDKYFPDFKPEDVDEVIREFSNRKRRFGGN
ncbi:MAG: polyprenyl diphosphate synthase [Candidatus Pacearchaeota archaeon]|nr:polyprenyl diphosphate synthase [Candidatus Pacearchaeota archaeon]